MAVSQLRLKGALARWLKAIKLQACQFLPQRAGELGACLYRAQGSLSCWGTTTQVLRPLIHAALSASSGKWIPCSGLDSLFPLFDGKPCH